MTSILNSKRLLVFGCAVWLLAVAGGMRFVWGYEISPGQSGAPPTDWPAASKLTKAAGFPTLVLFIHPHCPCSRATIGELALLMARSQGLVKATVAFVRPEAFTDEWEKTDLWASATSIPGVVTVVDINGAEASLFGSNTSGQTVLYNADGRLIFSGGITGSRGHSGDNDGRTAVLSWLRTRTAEKTRTAVFGCPLFKETPQSGEFCRAILNK
jgi:hypothetical protein